MSKSKSKKGFTLIEVICSVSIFSMLILFAIGIKVDEIKISQANYKTTKCTYFMDCLSKELMENASKEDIENLITEGKVYVSQDKIEDDNKEIDLNLLFSNSKAECKPYLVLDSDCYVDKLKVKLSMHTDFYGKEKVYTCIFEK